MVTEAGAGATAATLRRVDRRVQRTRQLLYQASIEVMREKGFTAMTIQDIATRANVNRGTFYAHFADKYALLEAIIRARFHDLLASTLPPVSRWDQGTLRLLIQTVLEYFAREHRQCHPADVIDPLIERATHEELTDLLSLWLTQEWGGEARWRAPVETIARVVSWAIFGAAVQWSQEATTLSAERMADDVLLVIMEGVARLAPAGPPG